MASLRDLVQPRSFGFQSQQGRVFDEANQVDPRTLAMLANAPQNFIQRTGGEMIDLGQSRPEMPRRGSPVDVFGQGRGYLDPSTGLITGTNSQGQQFRVQPEGTQAASDKARIAAEDRAMKIRKFEQDMAGVQAKPTFNADLGGFISPPDAQNPQGKFTPVAGITPKSQKPEKLTELQGKSALFGSRAAIASDIIDGLSTSGDYGDAQSLMASQDSMIPFVGRIANAVADKNTQKMVQAQRDFVNAVLRLESGAAIGKDEFENAAKQYFPQQGDSPEVLAQKKQNRELAIEGLSMMGGDQAGGYINEQRTRYKPQGADATQAPKLGSIVDGYVYIGGDAAQPSSWRKQ